MSTVSKGMRSKRFKLKPGSPVKFIIETPTGLRLSLVLDNCSITGIAGYVEGPLASDEGVTVGEMVPAAKIAWDNHEYTLGRLVARVIKPEGERTYIGFSTVDSRVPLDGPLSKFLDAPLNSANIYQLELNPEKFSFANFIDSNQSNVDLFHRCQQHSIYLRDFEKTSRYLYDTVREPSKGSRVKLNRKRRDGRNDFVVMGSNDYLGLASHPSVLQAAKDALDKYGFGSTGSPMTTGVTELHAELADTLAKMFHKEKAILFNSGYAANVGAISGLTTGQDLILADFLSHASIQDGMKMTKATCRFYKHNDVRHLEHLLKHNRDAHNGALIITEGVFSMDGDVPPLKKICQVAKQYNARVYLDEAHSFGVTGPNFLGAIDRFDVFNEVDVVMGTFSKICGGIGGFVAGPQDVMEWITWTARSRMFSVSVPPSTAAATLAALKIFRDDKSLTENLRANIRHFTKGLEYLGYQFENEHESAVIPVVIGDETKLGIMNQYLLENGVYVIPITFPAVSRKSCRFRFTVMATHTTSDLDYVLHVFEQAMNKANFKFNQDEEQGEDHGAKAA